MLIAATGLLLAGSYFWAKLQPELFYGVMQGYTRQELIIVQGFSFKDTVFYWGFETGILLAVLNLLKGLFFSLSLSHSQLFSTWQLWLGLCCLLVFLTNREISMSSGFWKRWTVFIGAILPLLLPLAQLTAAIFLSLLLLTNHKKFICLSSTAAGLAMLYLYPLPYPDKLFMLAACLLASFGRDLSHPISTAHQQSI